MKCDLNCPDDAKPQLCCRNCPEVRAYYVTPENSRLWTKKYGFWGKGGCKLSRKQMPKECVEYDCKKEKHFIQREWNRGKWTDTQGALMGKVVCGRCGWHADVRIENVEGQDGISNGRHG
jgi:hypothetical protein